jgi:septal ring-binding cell division protein DamX
LKPTKILLLSTAIFYLNACTLFDDTSFAISRQEYLGWYCEADIDISDQWRCSKRLMSDALPIDKLQPKGKRPLIDKPQAPEKIPKKTLKQEVDREAEEDISASFAIDADGYTVQMGAYLSKAMAEQSAGKIITDGDQLVVHSIIADGQYKFVIVQGRYPTRQQAQAAAERAIILNPQLEYWVRSIKSLRNSL